MADARPPLEAPEHVDAWAVAYLDETLTATERAAFIVHLKTHVACRELVETLRVAFPLYDRVLMEDGPPRTGKEYLAMALAAEAKIKAQAAPVKPPTPAPEKKVVRPRRGPVWAWGAGLAALASAAAAVLIVVEPFSPGLEPELLRAMSPAPIDPNAPPRPLPPIPAELKVQASIRFGRLEVRAPRFPTDAFAAVAVIDSKDQQWLVQSGDGRDLACDPGCGDLKLRVKLEPLAPGPLRVAVMVSQKPISQADVQEFLPHAGMEVPRWLGFRAFGVTKVQRVQR